MSFKFFIDEEGSMKSFTTYSAVLRRSPYLDKELENTTIKIILELLLNQKIQKPKLFTNADELDLKNLTIDDLKKFNNDIIVNYPKLIFDSGDFTSLKETALISLLKRDYLKVEEIKIWDYVTKWRISQNPTLPADLKMQCLPLIRYFHIPNEVIWKKVKPYKKILEKQLWDEIILHSVSNPGLPSRTISTPELQSILNEPFSSIINIEYVIELSSWIDKKSTYSSANIPYEFEFFFFEEEMVFIPRHFGTFAGTDEIVGDYNPLTWDNLKDDNMEINDRFYGPWFGVSEFTEVSNFTHDKLGFGINLVIMINLTIRTTTERFSIIDYELFEIIKKIKTPL
ncbi:hypothetical protein Glove_199g45 [Diversispora epigaea]|uniref:BACK domain-containing protein n=1 Tax=Diversispora epigaea TaxID=1348612 RepID=A0A397IT97_9GLOM|nr:hypothetical protein Glove_199g45 [Diversispora epigaea]